MKIPRKIKKDKNGDKRQRQCSEMEGREKWKSLNYENLEEKKKAMEI